MTTEIPRAAAGDIEMLAVLVTVGAAHDGS